MLQSNVALRKREDGAVPPRNTKSGSEERLLEAQLSSEKDMAKRRFQGPCWSKDILRVPYPF